MTIYLCLDFPYRIAVAGGAEYIAVHVFTVRRTGERLGIVFESGTYRDCDSACKACHGERILYPADLRYMHDTVLRVEKELQQQVRENSNA